MNNNPNNGQYGYQNGYQNNYQNNGYGNQGGFNPPPIDPFQTPFGQDYRIQQAHAQARTAHTMGIVALVGLICAGLLSLVCGILAIVNANNSRRTLGYDLPEGRSGRTMGIVALSISAVAYVVVIIMVAAYSSILL